MSTLNLLERFAIEAQATGSFAQGFPGEPAHELIGEEFRGRFTVLVMLRRGIERKL